MTRKPKPGYRFFKCPDCNHEWKAWCRDAETLSGDVCANKDCPDISGILITPHGFEYEKQTYVDPPYGHRYGFPKVLPLEKDLKELLEESNYPKKDIEFALKHSRYWEE